MDQPDRPALKLEDVEPSTLAPTKRSRRQLERRLHRIKDPEQRLRAMAILEAGARLSQTLHAMLDSQLESIMPELLAHLDAGGTSPAVLVVNPDQMPGFNAEIMAGGLRDIVAYLDSTRAPDVGVVRQAALAALERAGEAPTGPSSLVNAQGQPVRR